MHLFVCLVFPVSYDDVMHHMNDILSTEILNLKKLLVTFFLTKYLFVKKKVTKNQNFFGALVRYLECTLRFIPSIRNPQSVRVRPKKTEKQMTRCPAQFSKSAKTCISDSEFSESRVLHLSFLEYITLWRNSSPIQTYGWCTACRNCEVVNMSKCKYTQQSTSQMTRHNTEMSKKNGQSEMERERILESTRLTARVDIRNDFETKKKRKF